MLIASAMNVVDMTLMPGDAGDDDVEVVLVAGEDRAEQREEESGSRKLKNAALGLRQNIRRSSRYWRQARPPRQPRTASAGSSAVSSR